MIKCISSVAVALKMSFLYFLFNRPTFIILYCLLQSQTHKKIFSFYEQLLPFIELHFSQYYDYYEDSNIAYNLSITRQQENTITFVVFLTFYSVAQD